jgi:hypothetical protein
VEAVAQLRLFFDEALQADGVSPPLRLADLGGELSEALLLQAAAELA